MSVTCAHMTGWNGNLNTLHIGVYVRMNSSDYCQYGHTQRLGGVKCVINAMLLYAYVPNSFRLTLRPPLGSYEMRVR